ncbi:MAG: hypothetical protein GY745_22490 [Actinomycetia bacterium]|nr:hypothetical protein [Actinomycetes bacterium]
MRWVLERMNRMVVRRALGLLGPDRASALQSLGALSLAVVAAVVAGATLASADETIEELPGLILLVPASLAARGNVFGAFGSRLGTAIHTGTFHWSRRVDTVLGQNVVASVVLGVSLSFFLAVVAAVAVTVLGLSEALGLSDLIVISVVGGTLASVAVLLVSLALTAVAPRAGWDLDNVIAPIVTAAGDLLTIPFLLLATVLVQRGQATLVAAMALTVLSAVGLLWSIRSGLTLLSNIVRESMPMLIVAGILSLLAGVILESRSSEVLGVGAVLIILPGYLGASGALGGILSSRLSTKLVLGLFSPARFPPPAARADATAILGLAVPVFVLNGFMAHLTAALTGASTPGLARMILAALIGGVLATLVVVLVAYYATLAAVRLGVDPDNVAIPLVTATLDVFGVLTLLLALNVTGVV